MARDIRELLKKEGSTENSALPAGHLKRFETLLEKEFPVSQTASSSTAFPGWLKIAAAVIVMLGVGWMVWNTAFAKADPETSPLVQTEPTSEETPEEQVLLSDISPDFKRIEQRYLASVNLELSRLEINDDNKALVDAFLRELAELDAEYKRLNDEISQTGVSEEMVNALLENLQLRVELMIKLKAKLKELKAEANQAQAVQTV